MNGETDNLRHIHRQAETDGQTQSPSASERRGGRYGRHAISERRRKFAEFPQQRRRQSPRGNKASLSITGPLPRKKKEKRKKKSTTDQQRNKENFKTLGRNIYMYIVMCISTWLHQGGGGNRKEGRVVIHKGVSIIIIILLFIIITPFLPSPSAVYGSFGTCETELQHFSM